MINTNWDPYEITYLLDSIAGTISPLPELIRITEFTNNTAKMGKIPPEPKPGLLSFVKVLKNLLKRIFTNVK